MRSRKVLVVLPAYNEEENIGELLSQIQYALEQDSKINYKVFVVNDGSVDNTQAIAEEMSKSMPIEVLLHEVNQGLGATIRDGLYRAVQYSGKNDIIITMDADATHNPGLILRLIRMIMEGHDVVIASRFQPGARVIGLVWHRKLLSYLASIIFRITYPIKGVRDYTCGYRAIRADVLKNAMDEYGDRFVDQDGFQCLVDILLKLRKRKLLFGETPLILRYDQKGGMSKMNVSRTIKNTLILIVKRFFIK
ncbi:MAG: glycosyltransferase family 2 protein [Bacteroidia bacterium]